MNPTMLLDMFMTHLVLQSLRPDRDGLSMLPNGRCVQGCDCGPSRRQSLLVQDSDRCFRQPISSSVACSMRCMRSRNWDIVRQIHVSSTRSAPRKTCAKTVPDA